MVTKADLTQHIETTALAFRGYDVANLGRSRELLEHSVYGAIVRSTLDQPPRSVPRSCTPGFDLADFILAGEKTSLTTFPHDIATIVGMELGATHLARGEFRSPDPSVIDDVRLQHWRALRLDFRRELARSRTCSSCRLRCLVTVPSWPPTQRWESCSPEEPRSAPKTSNDSAAPEWRGERTDRPFGLSLAQYSAAVARTGGNARPGRAGHGRLHSREGDASPQPEPVAAAPLPLGLATPYPEPDRS